MIRKNLYKHILFIIIITLTLNSTKSFSDYITYKVQKGDTFFSLSRKFNVDIWLIQKENSITTLREGDVIRIPVRNTRTYTVQKGDTLFSLSRRFNTTIEEIISVNKLESIDIKVGQLLVIPIPTPKPTKTLDSPKKTSKNNSPKVYIVKEGDTIFSISRKTGTKVNRILELNNLTKDSKIYPGMKLIVDNYEEKSSTTPKSQIEITKLNYSLPLNFATQILNHSSRFLEIRSNKENRIVSVLDGEVIFVGSFSIFGKTVIIKHSENFYSIYGMISTEYVKVGEKVKKGEIIGISVKDPTTGNYIAKFSFIINDKMIVPSRI